MPQQRPFCLQQLKNSNPKPNKKPNQRKKINHRITNQWWNVGPAAVRGNISIYFVELFLLQGGKQTSYISNQNKIMCSWQYWQEFLMSSLQWHIQVLGILPVPKRSGGRLLFTLARKRCLSLAAAPVCPFLF